MLRSHLGPKIAHAWPSEIIEIQSEFVRDMHETRETLQLNLRSTSEKLQRTLQTLKEPRPISFLHG